MIKQKFYVSGTHCKSCEIVIERELKKQEGVEDVQVSHGKRTIEIQTAGEKKFTTEELNECIGKHGYSVTVSDNGKSKDAKPSINWGKFFVVGIIVWGLYVYLDWMGVLRYSPAASQGAGLISVLIVGLVASVSSCMAVVGGLVTAVASSVAKNQEFMSARERFQPHILFNIGRVVGFFILGAGIGWMGSVIQLNSYFNGLFIVVVALFMIGIGIHLVEIFPNSIIGMPKVLAHKVHDLSESKNKLAPVLLGAFTFFLPCGFTQSMQLLALTSQDPLQAGLIMGVFALGTAPVLLGIGGLTSTISGGALKKMTMIAGVLVLILGINNLSNGLALVGYNPSAFSAKKEVTATQETVVTNGKQQIQMEVTQNFEYKPSVLTVKVGVPVEWTIIGSKSMGCASSLILREFGVSTNLKPGNNLVKFTPTKAGKFTFSCSMGMIRGTMIVTP
ncbi:MAG: sulfite exporter TauE/SafE family protein [Patescibacteria group bacterium]